MASDPEFVTFVREQLRGAGDISSKRMFGEAAVYLDDKVVGLVCDNQLFVKPTAPGRALLESPTEAPPFPGATNWFLLPDLDDPDFLAELVRITAAALPVPKARAKRVPKLVSEPKGKAIRSARAKIKPKAKATPKFKPKAKSKARTAEPARVEKNKPAKRA